MTTEFAGGAAGVEAAGVLELVAAKGCGPTVGPVAVPDTTVEFDAGDVDGDCGGVTVVVVENGGGETGGAGAAGTGTAAAAAEAGGAGGAAGAVDGSDPTTGVRGGGPDTTGVVASGESDVSGDPDDKVGDGGEGEGAGKAPPPLSSLSSWGAVRTDFTSGMSRSRLCSGRWRHIIGARHEHSPSDPTSGPCPYFASTARALSTTASAIAAWPSAVGWNAPE